MALGSFCFYENDWITLQPKSLQITGYQKGFVQCLEIYQSIHTSKNLDQVSYIFPTDNTICIYNMKFQVGNETINAKIRSKEAAKETFQEAKKAGRTTVIAEQISPGITSISIGNVPKDTILGIYIQCVFTSTLSNPNTILTKIPLKSAEPDGTFTDLYSLPSLDISVDLMISQMQPISDVYTNCESTYEKVDEFTGKLKIRSAVLTDENILIMTELSSVAKSQILNENKTSLITLIPEFKPVKTELNEYVFLIDCSASMSGESMRKARESLHLFLEKLPESCFFNIIQFGTSFNKLFTRSSEKNEASAQKAKSFIDGIKANLGGTEMLSMLDDIFKDEIKIGAQRQIFIITDGEVFERTKVIKKIENNRGYNRIFAIGLGHGADAGFLKEITEITNGKSDFVFNKNDLPVKVAEQLELSFGEAVKGAEIHIEGNESFSIVPYPIPPLLPNVETHVFVDSNDPVENAILTAKLNKEDEIENIISLHSKFEISDSDNGEKSPLFALFAWNKLRCIKSDENESVRLSLESGVLCDFTSYVAVSENVLIEQIDFKKEKIKPIKSDLRDDDKSFSCFCSIKLRKVCADHDDLYEAPEKERGGSLFGGGDDFCYSSKKSKAHVKKRFSIFDDFHERKTEEVEMEKPKKKGGLFDDDDDDICYDFHERKTEEDKIEKPKKKGGLFDDDEDDICYDFHERKSEEVKIEKPKKKGGLFDDDEDDICYDSHERKSEEVKIEKPKKKGGLFDDDEDDICYDFHERKTEEDKIEKPKKKGGLFDDDHRDKIASNDDSTILELESDSDKIWDDDAPAINIIRLQSRNGFWDLPSSFVIKKNSGNMLLINEIDSNLSPIVKKRVVSTVFTLAYLKKFHNENPNKWKFAIEKGVCWLKMIVSANWMQIIEESMKDILK